MTLYISHKPFIEFWNIEYMYWYCIFVLYIATFVHLICDLTQCTINSSIQGSSDFVFCVMYWFLAGGRPVVTPISSPRPVAPNINIKYNIIYRYLCCSLINIKFTLPISQFAPVYPGWH